MGKKKRRTKYKRLNFFYQSESSQLDKKSVSNQIDKKSGSKKYDILNCIYDDIIFDEIILVCCEIFESEKFYYESENLSRIIEKSNFDENQLLVAKLNSELDKQRKDLQKGEYNKMILDLEQFILPLKEMDSDKGNFGDYPEIIKAVKKNELMLANYQRKLHFLKLDSNFPNISKTKQKVINTSMYSDEEYEYISD